LHDSEALTSEYISVLLQRQDMLQEEAQMVLEDLELNGLLSQVGSPVKLGSAALGLMVWPDIDITVSCPGLTIDRAFN
jgi:hypothetical protein